MCKLIIQDITNNSKKVIDQAAAVLILQQWLDGPFGGEVVTPESDASPTDASAKEGE